MTPDKAILEMLESVSKDDTDTLDEFEILEKFTRAFELIKENHPPTGNIENYSHIYVISASGEEIKITPFDVERARNILDNRTDKHQAIRAALSPAPVLDPDMPTQELRLHMGELTTSEVLVARAAIGWANTKHGSPAPVGEVDEYHEVMNLLQATKMDHGTCEPRKRRACTHCNAVDDLNVMIKEYSGPPVVTSQAPTAAPVEGVALEDALTKAMQEEWNDWCGDTGCFPDDFEWKGGSGKLYFKPGKWAANVARNLAAQGYLTPPEEKD